MAPEIIDSRIGVETPWLRLRFDMLRLRSGLEHDYGYIERPRAVIVAAIEDHHVWMVEQYRHPLRARLWELPMGVAPGGDATPITEAAAIELREETGVRAERFDYVSDLAFAPGVLAQTGALFIATGLTKGAAEPEATEEDIVAALWPVTRVLAEIAAGRIQCSTTVASFGLLKLRELI